MSKLVAGAEPHLNIHHCGLGYEQLSNTMYLINRIAWT